MTENPELRAKILDWQKRNNIQDGDPAIALLELVDLFGLGRGTQLPSSSGEAPAHGPVTAEVSSEAIAEAMKGSLLPFTDRMGFQIQDLQQKLEHVDFDRFVKQIEAYHEGIDYCTKRLDVIKKEVDQVAVKVEKAGSQIKPVSIGAIVVLVVVAFLVGLVISQVLKF
ncbi:hypothetical protein BH09VER1_BH09VER1_30350 [soil metagenome]